MSSSIQVTTSAGHREAVIGGTVLIAIGLLVLVAQNVKTEALGLLFLPALGGISLVAGVIGRQVGFLIPGGILTGIGVGAILEQSTAVAGEGTAQGGIFLLGFAGGWFLITALSKLFTHEIHGWPVIPGTIMALIGGALMLEFAGRWQPLILVALGLIIIVRRKLAPETNKIRSGGEFHDSSI